MSSQERVDGQIAGVSGVQDGLMGEVNSYIEAPQLPDYLVAYHELYPDRKLYTLGHAGEATGRRVYGADASLMREAFRRQGAEFRRGHVAFLDRHSFDEACMEVGRPVSDGKRRNAALEAWQTRKRNLPADLSMAEDQNLLPDWLEDYHRRQPGRDVYIVADFLAATKRIYNDENIKLVADKLRAEGVRIMGGRLIVVDRRIFDAVVVKVGRMEEGLPAGHSLDSSVLSPFRLGYKLPEVDSRTVEISDKEGFAVAVFLQQVDNRKRLGSYGRALSAYERGKVQSYIKKLTQKLGIEIIRYDELRPLLKKVLQDFTGDRGKFFDQNGNNELLWVFKDVFWKLSHFDANRFYEDTI